jgi:hypothetical protein
MNNAIATARKTSVRAKHQRIHEQVKEFTETPEPARANLRKIWQRF